MKIIVYDDTMKCYRNLRNTTETYENATETYENATKMLRLSYGDLQDCRLQDATHHYGDYSGYRFRGKVTWFADEA